MAVACMPLEIKTNLNLIHSTEFGTEVAQN